MAGPVVNQQSAQQVSSGANQSGGNPFTWAGNQAKALAASLNSQGNPTGQVPVVSNDDLMASEAQAASPADPAKAQHMANLKASADAAAEKYKADNGLDENLDPIQK